MHIPPQERKGQNSSSVIEDIDRQIEVLKASKEWIKNVTKAIQKEQQITFSLASRVTPESRDAQIAFEIEASGKRRDVVVFEVQGTYTQDEMRKALEGDIESIEVFHSMRSQKWLEAYHTRQFDKWITDKTHIWQGTEEATIAWLKSIVKQWLKYWMDIQTKVIFRDRQELLLEPRK